MKLMRRATIWLMMLATSLATVLAGTSPAQAAVTPPDHFSTSDVADLALPEVDCGRFTIRQTSIAGHFTKVTYFDENGDSARVIEHYAIDGLLTDLSTGQTLKSHFQENDVFTIVNGDWTVVASS